MSDKDTPNAHLLTPCQTNYMAEKDLAATAIKKDNLLPPFPPLETFALMAAAIMGDSNITETDVACDLAWAIWETSSKFLQEKYNEQGIPLVTCT